jgi:hypothetical protein
MCMKEFLPAAWYSMYNSSYCSEQPAAQYFTVLLWKKGLTLSGRNVPVSSHGPLNGVKRPRTGVVTLDTYKDQGNGTGESDPRQTMVQIVPFPNSIMGRDFKAVSLKVPWKPVMHDTSANTTDDFLLRVCVGTSHLESPIPPNLHSKPRQVQLRNSFKCMENLVQQQQRQQHQHSRELCISVFMGDMNWHECVDGEVPFPDSPAPAGARPTATAPRSHCWRDAWTETKGNDAG